MRQRRHKRKNSHVVIVTSDAVDAGTKEYRIRPWAIELVVLVLSMMIGAAIGILIFEGNAIESPVVQQDPQQDLRIEQLEEENALLQSQIEELNSTIQVLSATVTQKTESETSLTEKLEQQYIPTEFPLTSSATYEEITEGDPMCLFTATAGALVVATASGTVSAVNDDAEYGHNVWVDHGNGYVTIYRNQGEVKVKQGEMVRQGSTLFLINEDNSSLGYQMMKDGVYINPMDVLAISG